MARHKAKNIHDAQRNARLAWLAQQIAKGQTNTQIIIGLMAAFKCSEKIARENLKEVYERFSEIEEDTLALAKIKFMEMGMEILKECRDLCQMSAAVKQFELLAGYSGVTQAEKSKADNTPAQVPAPGAVTVRERITKLMKDKDVKAEAEKRQIDLTKLQKDLIGD